MTNDERQVLLEMCTALRETIRCQEEANLSWRALYLALMRKHFPNLEAEVLENRKDADFATELSVRLGEVRGRLEAMTEILSRQDQA